MTGAKLTIDDVKQLTKDPSGESRAEAAAKVAGAFASETLNDSERELAEEIFRMMVYDAEVRVREALAINLKDSSLVPHEVAMGLAQDVESVSLPILKFSEVLTDEDLVQIVRAQSGDSEEKQLAIAQRDGVSEAVADVIVEAGTDKIVGALVGNETAEISEKTFQKVIDNHGDSDIVQQAMVDRPQLPLAISERLVTIVSDQLKERLAERQNLNGDLATDLILQSRERATILLSEDSSQEELQRMIHAMHLHRRLTPSIVLRALCMGDVNFYEAALSELADIALLNTRKLVYDPGKLGFKALFDKASLPEAHYPAHRAALDVATEMEYDGEAFDRERYSRRMIERILTQYGDLGVEFDSDDLNYLLTKMDGLPSDIARLEGEMKEEG